MDRMAGLNLSACLLAAAAVDTVRLTAEERTPAARPKATLVCRSLLTAVRARRDIRNSLSVRRNSVLESAPNRALLRPIFSWLPCTPGGTRSEQLVVNQRTRGWTGNPRWWQCCRNSRAEPAEGELTCTVIEVQAPAIDHLSPTGGRSGSIVCCVPGPSDANAGDCPSTVRTVARTVPPATFSSCSSVSVAPELVAVESGAAAGSVGPCAWVGLLMAILSRA